MLGIKLHEILYSGEFSAGIFLEILKKYVQMLFVLIKAQIKMAISKFSEN